MSIPKARRDELRRLESEATPGDWRVEPGTTHLELRAPYQTDRAVARVYCDIDADFVAAIRGAAKQLLDLADRAEALEAALFSSDPAIAAAPHVRRAKLEAYRDCERILSILVAACVGRANDSLDRNVRDRWENDARAVGKALDAIAAARQAAEARQA